MSNQLARIETNRDGDQWSAIIQYGDQAVSVPGRFNDPGSAQSAARYLCERMGWPLR